MLDSSSLEEIKDIFTVSKNPPKDKDLLDKKYTSAQPITSEGQDFWVLFKNQQESRLFDYLQNKNNYRSKEKLFGIIIDEGYAYSTKKGIPHNLQLVLKKPWSIKEKNISRELEVVITDEDTENKYLLHNLYSKVRKGNT
jgi:hypothetical protein